MVYYEKMTQAVKSSIAYLEASILALKKKDEDCLADGLWRSAEELEYAMFLLSMKFRDENTTLNWRPRSDIKKAKADLLLEVAKGLLNECGKSMIAKSWPEVYKSGYAARCYLLMVQEDLAKKKLEAVKKK